LDQAGLEADIAAAIGQRVDVVRRAALRREMRAGVLATAVLVF
jgi:hypothetical protein